MRNSLRGSIAIAVLLGTGEQALAADQWVTMRRGTAFTFEAPRSLEERPTRGIDSFVGAYESEHFALWFDYGRWTSPFRPDAINDSRFASPAKLERLLIDGRNAQILTGSSDGSGNCDVIIDLFISGPSKDQNLFMTSCADDGFAADVRRIYQSVRFARGR